ncbi:MFS transporter [Rhizobium sp. ICMP 5592]|uniref:MFS transporter n=1 Tax=Rhizobium sp. ICMP 5592 TaxID=2292445 RepID=UPI0012975C8A|nr:MFS transporter [Rhizobium sp. ICMP 5592]MQB44309.1 MFS transporter [Rhizobium sp. ICMP 5592]
MSTLSHTSTSQAPMSGGARGALLVLCGAIFLEGIDVAMLNVALPAIRAELGLSTTTLSAVVSSYVLGYAGFMLLGGRAADIFGKRRVFLSALAVFIAFSGLGGFATEGWMLLTARFVTGIASAFMTPAGLALIMTNFPEGPQRNKAVLIYAGTAAGGFSLGLVAGGLLAAIDWRWVFFAPVILASLIFILTPRLVADDHQRDDSQRFDMLGAIILAGAMLTAAYGVTRLENPTHGLEWTLAAFAASAILWIAFIAIQRKVAMPLVRLGILRSRSLVRANLGALFFAGSFFGFQFLVSLYLQELMGWTSLQTSLALLAIGADAILAPTVTPWLVNRFGNIKVIFGGVLLAAFSYAWFLQVSLDWTYAAMFPSMILLGLAFSLAYGPLTILATDGIDESEQGLASGLVNTAFQFGAALGLSAASAVGVLALGAETDTDARLEALRLALLVPVVATIIGLAVTATGLGPWRKPVHG